MISPTRSAWQFVCLAVLTLAAATAAAQLPYDRTNPVFYDNDYANDYVDWYLMSLASAGEIRYVGISTSSSVAPYNEHITDKFYREQLAARRDIVVRGRAAGLRNVPTPLTGTRGHLEKPASGRIEDTRPLDSPGTRALIAHAHRASPAKPLVVQLGGPATLLASAYLTDPRIADKIIVAWNDNFPKNLQSYNGWADGWAATIVVQRLNVVYFPALYDLQFPRLSKDWIRGNLAESPAKEYMMNLVVDPANDGDGDGDGMPAVALMRPDYVVQTRRMSFVGTRVHRGHEIPHFGTDRNGNILVATGKVGAVATAEYQRALRAALGKAAVTAPPPPPPPPKAPPPTPVPPQPSCSPDGGTALRVTKLEIEVLQQDGSIDDVVFGNSVGAAIRDDFSTDASRNYVPAGDGVRRWDPASKSLTFTTGDNKTFWMTRALPASERGELSLNFTSTETYHIGGVLRIRLRQDAQNYYEIESRGRYGSGGYGPGHISKVVRGRVIGRAAFTREHPLGIATSFSVRFQPNTFSVTALGGTLRVDTPAPCG